MCISIDRFFHWNKSAQYAIGSFVDRSLPWGVRMGEVNGGAKGLHRYILGELTAIVRGDGAKDLTEFRFKFKIQLTHSISGENGGFTFVFAPDDCVGFPVSKFTSQRHFFREPINAFAVQTFENSRFSVLSAG